MKNKKLLLSCSVCLLLVLAALPLMSACAKAPQTAGPPVSTKGYSIFDETMADMAWPAIDDAAKKGAIILFPTGVIEEHGPHQAAGLDTYEGYIWSKHMKHELEAKGIQTLMAPPFYWGTGTMSAFPGSFEIKPENMKAVLSDAFSCLKKWGFNNVFVCNWHGGNEATLLSFVKDIRGSLGINAYFVIPEVRAAPLKLTGKEEYVLIVPAAPQTGPPEKYVDFHAGKGETGYMAAFFPDLVNKQLAKTLKSTDLTGRDAGALLSDPAVFRQKLPQGYIGDPASFDAKDYKADMEDSGKRAANTIEALLKGTYKPPEIKPGW